MNYRLSYGMLLALALGCPAYALDPPPEPVKRVTVALPITLLSREKISDKRLYHLPAPPEKYIDGTPLNLKAEEKEAPLDAPMRILGDPSATREVPSINKKDHGSGKYFWHPFKGWNYTHFRWDGNNWYGWRTGETYHWVLWKLGHFWWHDAQTGRWLYFNEGYWWWQSSSKTPKIQVYLEDGHYHTCNARGELADELIKRGKEELTAKSSPQ